MHLKTLYAFIVLMSIFCFGYVSWMGKGKKTNHHRIKKQKLTDLKEPNSSECQKVVKTLVAIPKRFAEKDYVKLFKVLQKCRWVRNKKEHEKLRSRLGKCCNASRNFIVTQENSPLETNISYYAEPKRIFEVTPDVVHLFPKTIPFKQHKYKTCSIVGNAGILINSSCGAEINRADFVFRCNLAPLTNYTNDVGTKTDIVTSNPTIIIKRFQKLNLRRKPFIDHLSAYKDAFIMLPAFAYSFCTPISFKVLYTLEDFGTNQHAVFLNPSYIGSIVEFWKNEGVKEKHLSSGFIILSAALEMCEEVRLYGFWPFSNDVHGKMFFHHYYDNVLPSKAHSLPAEFFKLMQLHTKGIVKLQVGNCEEE
ncbi:alpha-2,8-sialyltransferase 8F-like [Rhinoraja longicauda]